MQFTSLAGLVKSFESSGGNYTAVNPTSGAGGAYQFVPSTWRQYAGQIGIDTSLYPRAELAPPSVQDAVFQQAVAQRGLGDWTCPGCNPPLTRYVAANPAASGLPVFEPGTSGNGSYVTAPSSFDSGASAPIPSVYPADIENIGGLPPSGLNDPVTGLPYDPSIDPGTGKPALGGSLGDAVGAPLTQVYQAGLSYLTRGGLILLGVGLVVVAAWAAARGEFGEAVKKAVA